jgi:patatin-like phospholipase/acyl hydrolase
MVLNYIEERTRKRIATMFDLIAGTSTGGILALGLTKRNSDSSINQEPEYTAAELLDFYRRYGKNIFDEYIPTPIDDLVQPKFNPHGKQQVLTNLLGETCLKDALRNVFITSYDLELRIPVFFTNNHTMEETEGLDSRKVGQGFTMVEAAMATSAAPTFFPPYQLQTVHHTNEGYYVLVDGGIFANNPTSLAMMETMIAYKKKTQQELQRNDTLVVSLGTGSLTRRYKYKDVKNWGQLKWALPLLNIVFDGQSESVAYQLSKLMNRDCRNYYRFQVPLSSENGHDQMDNASPGNIEYLEKLGKRLIEVQKNQLNDLCEVLCQPLEEDS